MIKTTKKNTEADAIIAPVVVIREGAEPVVTARGRKGILGEKERESFCFLCGG